MISLEVSIYSDGGCVWSPTRIGSKSSIGGTWSYCLVHDGKRYQECSGILLPRDGYGGVVTNNVTELHALTLGILAAPDGCIAHIYSDNDVSLKRVFEAARMNQVPQWLVAQTQEARAKLSQFERLTWTLLAGHPSKAHLAAGFKDNLPVSEFNVWCDKACGRAWKEYIYEGFSMPVEEMESAA